MKPPMRPDRFVVFCAAAALVSGCGRPAAPGGEAGADLPPAAVALATVHAESLPSATECPGSVRPLKSAQVAAKVMGAIVEMPVALGQRVRAGDLLARIGAEEIAARLAEARAQLSTARRDLERERELLAKDASTAETVKGLEDRFSAAQAAVRGAEAMQGYTELRAPFDGAVARKMADVGDLASPGRAILEIESAGEFQVEAAIPDSLAAHLAPGAPVAVEIPSRGVAFAGALAELSSAADPGAHTVVAKIRVPAGIPAGSGEFARVQVAGAPVATLLAPASAVAAVGQLQRVFVAGEGNRAVLRLVRTGASHGDRVEILSGLEDGERVVVAPPAGLREGRLLEARP